MHGFYTGQTFFFFFSKQKLSMLAHTPIHAHNYTPIDVHTIDTRRNGLHWLVKGLSKQEGLELGLNSE